MRDKATQVGQSVLSLEYLSVKDLNVRSFSLENIYFSFLAHKLPIHFQIAGILALLLHV